MGRQPNTTDVPERSGSVQGLEENLKKAVSEMLVLFLLNEREMYIGEIPEELERRSDGKFHIVFPYSVIYRMVKFEYIDELKKRVAPDGRKRQYYGITPKGREYLVQLTDTFGQFMQCIELILKSEDAQKKRNNVDTKIYNKFPDSSESGNFFCNFAKRCCTVRCQAVLWYRKTTVDNT